MNTADNSSPINQASLGRACPYLGLLQDSQTSLKYPSASNMCYHCKPVASPSLDHQMSYCLQGRKHTQCPVFINSDLEPLPAEIRNTVASPITGKQPGNRTILPLVLILPILLLGALGFFWLFNGQNPLGLILPGMHASPTSTPTLMPHATETLPITVIPITPNTDNTLTLTNTPVITIADTATATLVIVTQVPFQTALPCGAPANWIIYIVKPGDTLYGLSLSYGVGVAQLQQANCLGNSTLLQTGQRLYVPPWAAVVPSATLPLLPSLTSTQMPIPTLTDTPEPTLPLEQTDTPVPPASDTPIPTEISTP